MQTSDALRHHIPIRLHVLAVILFAVLIVSIYANSLAAGFALDSRGRVLDDPRISAISKNNLTLIFTENYWWPRGYTNLYRPITTLSYVVNRALLFNPEDAAGYRVFNVLLHVANAYLLYLVALLLMHDWWRAMLTSSLWAIHPVCTESVTNIVGRADELSAMAVLGALLLYARAMSAKGLNRWLWRSALMLTTLLGLLAKEIAAVIPGVAFLYDVACSRHWSRPSGERRAIWTGYLVFLPPFLIAWYLRASTFGHGGPLESPFVDNPVQGAGFLTGRLTAIKVIGKYIWLLVWPLRQSCDYSYNQVPLVDWRLTRLEDWKAVVGLTCLVLLMAVAIALLRVHRAGFFFLGLSAVTLVPVSNLVIPIGTIMAERLLYLPAAGFAGCVVLAVYAATRQRRKTAVAVLAIVIALASVRTYARNLDWDDDETLWTQAVKASPDSFKTHLGLAQVRLYAQPLNTALDGAIQEEEKALHIIAGLPLDKSPQSIYAELGELYRLKGESLAARKADGTSVSSAESRIWYDKALRVLERGAAIDREVATVLRRQELARGKEPRQIPLFGMDRLYASLGLTNLRLDQPRQALEAFLYQRRLDPDNPAVYRSIASAHLASGSIEAAAVALIGAHLLSDSDVDQAEIRDLYERVDRQNCTVTQGLIPAINLDCPMVRSGICASLLDIAGALRERRLEAGVRQMQDVARGRYACPMEAFERLSR